MQDFKNVFFPVQKVPVKELGIQLKPNSNISHAIVGAGKVVNFCSENYGLVTNRDIHDKFMEFFQEKGIGVDFTATGFNHSRFRMDFRLTDFPYEIEKGDKLFPNLRVYNSYDGTQRFKSSIQVMRLICSNGLTAMVDEQVIRYVHSPKVEDGLAIGHTLENIEGFMEEYEDVNETFEILADSPVRDVNMRIEEVGEEIGFPKALMEFAMERAAKEMKEMELRSTDWVVYNALNYQLNHNADHLMGRKSDKLDKQVLDYLLTY
jgi:hypothetical protein